LKKGGPVDGQQGAERSQNPMGSSRHSSQACFRNEEDKPEGQASEENPAQDDEKGGKREPFAKKPGQAEEQRRQMDFNEALTFGHSSYRSKL